MTRKHHPQDRAERLRLKGLHEKKVSEERPSSVRRKLFKEQVKLKETEDDLTKGSQYRSLHELNQVLD